MQIKLTMLPMLFLCITCIALGLTVSVFIETVPEAAVHRSSLGKWMATYQTERAELAEAANLTQWIAYNSGKEEDFDKAAAASLALDTFHSSTEKFAELKELNRKVAATSSPLKRAANLAELAFAANQLSPEMLEKLTEKGSEIEQIFQNFRGILDGKTYTNNELIEMMSEEMDTAKRKAIWETLKQVGQKVAPKLVELAKIRNEAAKSLGYDNFWQMQVYLQEYDAAELIALFAELEKDTSPIFADMKKELDSEIAEKFGISPAEIMPWHYDNPYFQQAPPSKQVDPNVFYKNKKSEEIVDISVNYFTAIGLPVDKILAKSDLYERPGKSQHAFSFDIRAPEDVRILCNIKPTVEWMDTQLHELGHAVYGTGVDPELPANLRDSAHIFTTEGVAMFFGAKAREPQWMVEFAGVPADEAAKVAVHLREQRRREQLIFARYTIVMLNFEKAMYENPDADLNTMWWDMAEKYQLLQRPKNRHEPDWASKTHFAVAPVYYHNYQVGELFAAQLRHRLGPLSQQSTPELGRWFDTYIFKPGASLPWQEFVRQSTGEPLSAKFFADEVKSHVQYRVINQSTNEGHNRCR